MMPKPHRDKVAGMYNERLRNIEEIEVPYVSDEVKISWFVYVIRLRGGFTRVGRDEIIKRLGEKGIQCRAYFSPIHLQPFYRKMFGYKRGDFPVTEGVSDRTIALPFYNNLKEKEINFVVKSLKELLKRG